MKPNRYTRWTPELLDMVAKRYATEDTRTLAAEIGCTVSALQSKAQILGVTKNPEPWQLHSSAPKHLKNGVRREIASGLLIQNGAVTTHISRFSALLDEE